MRVVGGKLRGRHLESPPGRKLRPTSDRTREAVFDLLGPEFSAQKVLDLFAGTGALGIEALSRGCQLAVFVEQDRTALGIIRDNLSRCGLSDRARVEAKDVMRFLERLDAAAPFGLVLLDPPYGQGLVEKVLEQLVCAKAVAKGGVVVCEAERGLKLPKKVSTLVRTKHKRYGETSLHLYVCAESESE